MASLLGKYGIEREIGRGATGIVYLAHDPETSTRIALKVLMVPHTVQGAAHRDLVERFRREARSAASIRHARVPLIYDVGEASGRHYIAMEYCHGRTLRDILRMEGPRHPAEAVRLTLEVLDALTAAHTLGVVHRDIKPDNVIVQPDGHIKLMDFGIARAVVDSTLTSTGAMLGTPAYMSPEQITGQRGDARSDVFAVGIMLHELIAGSRPFGGAFATEVLVAITTRDPVIARSVQPQEAAVILRATMRDPSHRFDAASEMADALLGKVPAFPSNWIPPVSASAGSYTAAAAAQPHPMAAADPLATQIAGSGGASPAAAPTPHDPTATVYGAPPQMPPYAPGPVPWPPAPAAPWSPPAAGQTLYAGFGVRCCASILDAIFRLVIFVLLCPFFGVAPAAVARPFTPEWMFAVILGNLMSFAYDVGFVARCGQTPGKMVAGVRIVRLDGSPVDAGTAILRTLGYLLSNMLCGLGFLWVAWDPLKQGFHDKVAGTTVIHIQRYP